MDTFEAMLTPTQQVRNRVGQEIAARKAAGKPVTPAQATYRAPSNNAPPATVEARKTIVRPDYADDIDHLVAAMVRAGDVVMDTETDQYRRPHYRRYRFTTS